MVQVCVLRQAGQPVGFEAKGHAEFSEEGFDIVCSAVSALTQTTVLGLHELLKLDMGLSMEDGHIHCILGRDCTAEQCRDAALLLNTMILGLRSIENTYGEYLSITEREV